MPDTEANIISCLNNKCNKTIYSGEKCSRETAKALIISDLKNNKNIFDKKLINDDDQIETYIKNIIDYKKTKSVCSMIDGDAYRNCALHLSSPWFTLNANNTKCTLPTDIRLPSIFVKDTTDPTIIKKPYDQDIREYADSVAYCQEKWFDWFTIPDYHLGNVFIAKRKTEHPRNVDVCYKPCPIGKVPYNNGSYENIGKCIDRSDIGNGIYKGTSLYSPLAFINLLGNTEKDLIKYYLTIFNSTSNLIEKDPSRELKQNVVSFIKNTDIIKHNIVQEAKIEIGTRIAEFINRYGNTFSHLNVIEPPNYVQTIINPISTLFRIDHSYNICRKFYDALETKKTTGISSDYDTIYNEIRDITMPSDLGSGSTGISRADYEGILLKIFKKASNICFSNENSYSKNIIYYTLNTNKKITDGIDKYKPFKFDIKYDSTDDRIDPDTQTKKATKDAERTAEAARLGQASASSTAPAPVSECQNKKTALSSQTCPYKNRDIQIY